MAVKRLDRDGAHRKQFENNKKRIYAKLYVGFVESQ